MTFSLLIAQLINGLQTGSVYALVALGYSMVYGIIKLLNFAHGDIIMIGAYMVYYAIATFALPPVVAIVMAVAVAELCSMRVMAAPATINRKILQIP